MRRSTRYFGPRLGQFLVHRSFQFKYILLLAISVGLGSLLFLLPAFYFLRQNYHIFLNLAFHYNPGLVEHLEKETLWLSGFLIAAFMAIMVLATLVATKLTRNLISPLIGLEKHMKTLMNGNWDLPSVQVDGLDEDFRELAITYDYLYRSLRAQTENDLRFLNQINVDPRNRDACMALERLMKQKKNQLGIIDTVTITDQGYYATIQDADARLVDLGQNRLKAASSPTPIGTPNRRDDVKPGVPSSRRAV